MVDFHQYLFIYLSVFFISFIFYVFNYLSILVFFLWHEWASIYFYQLLPPDLIIIKIYTILLSACRLHSSTSWVIEKYHKLYLALKI